MVVVVAAALAGCQPADDAQVQGSAASPPSVPAQPPSAQRRQRGGRVDQGGPADVDDEGTRTGQLELARAEDRGPPPDVARGEHHRVRQA
jgi:hypothetical protein